MQESPKPAALALVALGLAIVADVLLRGASWGINIALLALGIMAACVGIGRSNSLQLTRTGRLMGVLALLFAVLFALRDSNSLKAANGFALAFCLGTMLLPVTDQALRESSFGRMIFGPFFEICNLAAHASLLASEANQDYKPSEGAEKRGKAILKGILFAFPLLLAFGALFASADAVFRAKLTDLLSLNVDPTVAFAHIGTILVCLVLVGALLRRLFIYRHPNVPPIAKPPTVVLGGCGITEIGMALGSLNLLFASFLAVQFRYLFGASDVVKATHGLSRAEYARGGFFELVAVAALALSVLLIANSMLKRESARDETIFRWFGRSLVAMVFLVVFSALTRMKLYTDAFGLTELRVYSSIFMGWLALCFVWMLATTLNGRPRKYVFGSFLAGLFTIFGANIIDPDRLIVRMNLARPEADFAYLKTLSDDAVLAMQDFADRIPAARRDEAIAFIANRRAAIRAGDWREFNLSRWRLSR